MVESNDVVIEENFVEEESGNEDCYDPESSASDLYTSKYY